MSFFKPLSFFQCRFSIEKDYYLGVGAGGSLATSLLQVLEEKKNGEKKSLTKRITVSFIALSQRQVL